MQQAGRGRDRDEIVRPGIKLPPRLDASRAAESFARKRGLPFLRPRRLGIELVYIPVYVVEARFSDPSRQTEDRVRVAVDGILGGVRRLDREIDLGSALPAAPEDILPARLDRTRALELARDELPWMVLPVALKHKRRLPPGEVELHCEVGYPYWVEHLRRGRYRDFRALDGASGAVVGARGKALLVRAFLDVARG